MDPFFPAEASPFRCIRQGGRIVFENEYVFWEHDPERGGELCGAYVKNGSGENLITDLQRVSVGIIENNSYHVYGTNRLPPVEIKVTSTGLELLQSLADSKGDVLEDVQVRHKVEYSPWGYGKHMVTLRCARDIRDIGQLQIASFGASSRFQLCAVRDSLVESAKPEYGNIFRRWLPMYGGTRRSDCPLHMSRHLPVSVLLLKPEVEALEISFGDDLSCRDFEGLLPDTRQLCYIASRETTDYEVRFSVTDSIRKGLSLSGECVFSYSMTLPHVKEYIVPVRQAAGVLLRSKPFEERWPSEKELRTWHDAGVELMRLHNDGDLYHNGIFWRDGAYPPYPPEEMAKMDSFLKAASSFGIHVVPYFSAKEFHPEAEGFRENASLWGRDNDSSGQMLVNWCGDSAFGAQMCLASPWKNFCRENIGKVLDHHAFNGVYFDWCTGSECLSSHGKTMHRHWDNDALQELLEWSRLRVGEKGETYLHLTLTPNLRAENLATLILTEEQPCIPVSPEMFSPHVSFLNVAPRQVCDMLRSPDDRERRKFAMCALLHHAAVSSVHPVYLALYREVLPSLHPEEFFRHASPGSGIIQTDSEETGGSIYWNNRSVMVCLANLSERPAICRWRTSLPRELSGKTRLDGLEFRILRFEFK